MAPKKKASDSICFSCTRRGECEYFRRYANPADPDSEKDFSIEIMECDDFNK